MCLIEPARERKIHMKGKAKTAKKRVSRTASSGMRRESIFMALHDCIIDKGYAATSLADVAHKAGMSPSHLLYYFPGKSAILARYFAHMASRIIERLDALRGEAPAKQIELLATLFFASKGISKSEIGFMLECFGVAVHDKELQREKVELDRFCKAYLRELFAKLPDGPANPAEAAEVAYALLVGLRTAAYFDEHLSPQQALDIFRTQIQELAKSGQLSRSAKSRVRSRRLPARHNGKTRPQPSR